MSIERKIRWEEMLPDELLEAIRIDGTCYFAYGLAEPHGAYSALGLDWLKAQALVERAANEHGGVVAPPFAWHVHERPFFPWFEDNNVKEPLCSAIPAELFLQVVLYQIRAADARGFRAVILLTGHYGGLENDMKLLCDYYTRKTNSPMKLAAFADGELIQYGNYHGDHGGICETSQLMALRPELVELDKNDSESRDGPWVGTEFPTPDGLSPSRELGENIVTSQIRRIGEVKKELLAAHQPRPDGTAPDLYETADIWRRFESLTRKYWWCSLTLNELKRGEILPFPGWEELGEK